MAIGRLHRLSSAEYRRMVDSGALEGMPVELLDGLLVEVSPQGERQARAVQRLMQLFAARLDLLRVQMPLALAEGWAPEPDIALAEPDPDPAVHPRTAFLVVEVAITSQPIDLGKAPIYARAGIPHFWLADLPARRVVEHSDPQSTGYRAVRQRSSGETLNPEVDGVSPIAVADVLD